MTSQIKSGKHLSSRSKKSPVDEAGLTLQVVNEANLTLVGGRKSLPWLRHQPNLSSIQNRPPAKGETLVNEEDECTFTRKYMSNSAIKSDCNGSDEEDLLPHSPGAAPARPLSSSSHSLLSSISYSTSSTRLYEIALSLGFRPPSF
ncbi:hypothetical protein PGTUg99_036574 [Puccinia graminis f. sp. tritici]|uniref:Uncharacterized protein n=1 Tax=Puccinia graminis f. sp. tritici TaxID=56615 RepID=A0A5B0QV50_PUCGR|nr:hypothetical protein PGTUg99_036574 [Puccinia graminis f. sp. tritici]